MLLKQVFKFFVGFFCWFAVQGTSQAVVVTNFNQASIEAALTNGGTITFGTNAVTNATISLTNTLFIRTNTAIDGGNLGVTFSGSSTTRVFFVTNNVTFTLANLTVANGRNTNGAGIFNSTGATLNITNCTLSGHLAFGGNGKNGNNGSNGNNGGNGSAGTNAIGGAIYNLGMVNIENSLISSNTASGGDGGAGGDGGDSSSFGGDGGNGANGAVGWGGGIYNGTNGTVFIINSTLTNNFALGGFGGAGGQGGTAQWPGLPGDGGAGAKALGGGIYNLGSVIITNSTVVTNAAIGGDAAHAGPEADGSGKPGKNGGGADGGGIYNLGTVFVGNSTFTQNLVEGGKGGDVYSGTLINGGDGGSGRGGAIFSSNAVTVVSSTLATNNATGGPGGINPYPGQNGSKGSSLGGNVYRLSGPVFLRNAILSKGASGANYSGSTSGIDGGHNISSDGTCSFTSTFGSRNNLDAKLVFLADNGGPTATMALRTNSPAIDMGDPNSCEAADQRGVIRPQGNGCDIGAFELVPTYSISGKIFEGTNGVSNIVVSAGSQTATSQAKGDYAIYGLVASNYVVTPTPVGAGFTPASTEVTVGTNAANPSGSVSNINFFANAVTIGSPSISFPPTNASLSNAVFSLQISAMPQRTYKVQYSTNLSSTNWKNISTNLSTTNGSFEFNQTNLTKEPERFFRVIQ